MLFQFPRSTLSQFPRALISFLDIKLMKLTRKLLLDLKTNNVHGDLASRITEIVRRIGNHESTFADGKIEEIVDAPPVSSQ